MPQVSLLQDDAARLPLPDHSIDAVYSRFGIIFFADPSQAFVNIRRMIRPGGRIGFVCWRSIRENELDSLHFGFERLSCIQEVLRGSGFDRITVEPFDTDVLCGDVDTTLEGVTQVGALGKILRETPALRPQ